MQIIKSHTDFATLGYRIVYLKGGHLLIAKAGAGKTTISTLFSELAAAALKNQPLNMAGITPNTAATFFSTWIHPYFVSKTVTNGSATKGDWEDTFAEFWRMVGDRSDIITEALLSRVVTEGERALFRLSYIAANFQKDSNSSGSNAEISASWLRFNPVPRIIHNTQTDEKIPALYLPEFEAFILDGQITVRRSDLLPNEVILHPSLDENSERKNWIPYSTISHEVEQICDGYISSLEDGDWESGSGTVKFGSGYPLQTDFININGLTFFSTGDIWQGQSIFVHSTDSDGFVLTVDDVQKGEALDFDFDLKNSLIMKEKSSSHSKVSAGVVESMEFIRPLLKNASNLEIHTILTENSLYREIFQVLENRANIGPAVLEVALLARKFYNCSSDMAMLMTEDATTNRYGATIIPEDLELGHTMIEMRTEKGFLSTTVPYSALAIGKCSFLLFSVLHFSVLDLTALHNLAIKTTTRKGGIDSAILNVSQELSRKARMFNCVAIMETRDDFYDTGSDEDGPDEDKLEMAMSTLGANTRVATQIVTDGKDLPYRSFRTRVRGYGEVKDATYVFDNVKLSDMPVSEYEPVEDDAPDIFDEHWDRNL